MHRDLRSWLSVRPEYPNFQLNETFFKPFEHLICTEQCDCIVENQVRKRKLKSQRLFVFYPIDCEFNM
jgi:hypothetical protein